MLKAVEFFTELMTEKYKELSVISKPLATKERVFEIYYVEGNEEKLVHSKKNWSNQNITKLKVPVFWDYFKVVLQSL
jgi:UDP-2,3-diacylglucosamine pyrophosphatase LpxH